MRGVPLFVLGGGSNVVIADGGFGGLVLQMAIAGVTVAEGPDGTIVTSGAGEPWDGLVESVVGRGLCGVECLSGIPGTVGGTPIQNVGAYGQEVSAAIQSVVALDRSTSGLVDLASGDCGFAYRMSRFKGPDAGRFVVCEVRYRLRRGPPTVAYPDVVSELESRRITGPALSDVREAVLAIRRRKGMVLDPDDPDTRSVGSFFMNPVVSAAERERLAVSAGERVPGYAQHDGRVKIPAAWLIERSGFRKGHAEGAVGLSTRHPLAIINRGEATTRAVLGFAARIKRAVIDWGGIWLRPEPEFVGLDADEDVEFLRKASG
jgi:UDP-N-acetylmuramate dehydrogenase